MKLHTEIHVQAPAEQAWHILGEQFGEIAGWAGAIQHSSVEGPLQPGTIRTCEIKGFGNLPPSTITEELTIFDREQQQLAYVLRSGMPGSIQQATNHWKIKPTQEGHCLISSQATLRVAWWFRPLLPLLKHKLHKDIKNTFEELRYRIEHGRPHPRKG